MGQTVSTTNTTGTNLNATVRQTYESIETIKHRYNVRALRQFTPTELTSFRSLLNVEQVSVTDPLTDEQVIRLLRLPPTDKEFIEVMNPLFNMLQILSNFPFINRPFESISGVGLLKCILLANPTRCKRYVNLKTYDQTKLLFIALGRNAFEKIELSSMQTATECDCTELIRTFDDVVVDELEVYSDTMLLFLTWLLILSVKCPTDNCKLDLSTLYDEWSEFKTCARWILRSILRRDEATGTYREVIRYTEFKEAVDTIIPRVFRPLSMLLEHLLFIDSDLKTTTNATLETNFENVSKGEVLTHALYAQLLMCVPRQFELQKIHKLYSSKTHGFSMREIQSKTFKFRAPTLLLVSGSRIDNDETYAKTKNRQYGQFLREYPKLKQEDQQLEECYLRKGKLIYAVLIKEPWQITNKSYFGGEHTTIIQLSPRLDIYNANQSDVVYFNTLGGGIGIGCTQPKLKVNSRKYAPGSISLTIDNALEFGVFRHTGYGGSFNPSELAVKRAEQDRIFEIKFTIRHVEIWGLADEKVLEEQRRELMWEEAESKRRQSVNLRMMSEDRALLEMAGLIGRRMSGGSI